MRLRRGPLRVVLGILFSSSVSSAQSSTPSPPPNAVTIQFERFADIFGSRLVAAFDSIPAAQYAYRPTKAQQSVGYIAQHLEDANYGLCERLTETKHEKSAKDALADTLKARWPKDTLVARLRASLRFCDAALDGIKHVNSAALASTLLAFETDLAEHYSQVSVYMRLPTGTALPSRWLRAISLIVFATLSCSSSVEPRPGVTLLVTNGTCQGGHCDSLRVLGFPSNQPNTPGGLWSLDLGLVTTSQECLRLPPTAVFRVIGVHDGGGADTTSFTWTNASSLSLGAQPPSSSQIVASPSTIAFVPADAAGWQITVPGGAQPTSSSACTP